MKRKEQETIDLTSLPRNAAQCKIWLGATVSVVTSASYDRDLGTPWSFEAIRPGSKFDDLADAGGEATRDDKLGAALAKAAASQDGAKVADLAAEVNKETGRMWPLEPPRLIRGRQLLQFAPSTK